jgi:hypothetical protein
LTGGVKTLRSIGETEVDVDPCGNAEGILAIYDESMPGYQFSLNIFI